MRPKLIMLAVSVVLGLALSELGLRFIDYAPGEFKLFQPTASGRGSYRLLPNLSVTIPFDGRGILVRTNSHGMRSPEVPVGPVAGRRRVAFVGDSFTFGEWADSVENSFVGGVASSVKGQGIDVLNFGVPGYGFEDIELIIREQVLQFKPDAIVLVSYNGNDFLDTYLGLHRFAVSRTGMLVLEDARTRMAEIPAEFHPPADAVRTFAKRHVYLARVANVLLQALRRVDITPSAAEATPAIPASASDRSIFSNLFWSQTAYPPFAAEARDASLHVLARIAALCAEEGVSLRIASLPSRDQVMLGATPANGLDRALPQRYVAEFAQAHAVPYLDLLPGLTARDAPEGLYHFYDGHLNTAGHLATAALLTPFVSAAVD